VSKASGISACSARRRRSSSHSGTYEPARSLGSPARSCRPGCATPAAGSRCAEDTKPVLPGPDGPVDPTVSAYPVDEVDRPARFTLMAPGWMPRLRSGGRWRFGLVRVEGRGRVALGRLSWVMATCREGSAVPAPRSGWGQPRLAKNSRRSLTTRSGSVV
jgi:hypothetical protein